jgi:hypothetical protein
MDIGGYLIEKGFTQVENPELSKIFNTKNIKIYQAGELHIVVSEENIITCMPSEKRIHNEPTWIVSASSNKQEIRNIIKKFLHKLNSFRQA